MSENFYISEKNKALKDILAGFLDVKFFGVIYGEPLTGKTTFVKNFYDSKFVNYVYVDLLNQNLHQELEDLDLSDYTVLIIDNAHLLTEKNMEQLLKKYKTNENLSILLIGIKDLKEIITKGHLKKYINVFNFILEWEKLNFDDFKQFLKEYMSEKGISIIFTKGALKDFYKKSEGKIGKVIYLLYNYKDKKFVYKISKTFLFSVLILLLIANFLFFYITSYQNQEKVSKKITEVPSEVPSVKLKNENSKAKPLPAGYLYDNKKQMCYDFLYYTDLRDFLNKNNKSINSKSIYLINIGAFKYEKDAKKLYEKILKIYNLKVSIKKDEKRNLYKVRLKFYNEEEAKNTYNLIKKEIKDAFMVKLKNE